MLLLPVREIVLQVPENGLQSGVLTIVAGAWEYPPQGWLAGGIMGVGKGSLEATMKGQYWKASWKSGPHPEDPGEN